MTEPGPEDVRLRRSLLFVPAVDPRKLARARDAAADALVFDLEDSVPPERKAAARDNLSDALAAGGFGAADLAVRVNAADTPWFEADLDAALGAGVRTVMIPKAERPEALRAIGARLEGLEAGAGGRTRLLLLVESPAGVVNAPALAAASPRVAALCFGNADFALAMGLAEVDAAAGVLFHARCALAIAARAAGVSPLDGIHLAVKDERAFREDAALGLRLGFDGKLCIHPRQAEIANEVYTPTREEIDRALRVVEAAERARAEGRGAFELDGRMVDAPLVALERRVLGRARRAGVLSP